MKNQRIFPGIILLGFGTFFFMQQYGVNFLKGYETWPTLLIIVGVAFLAQGYGAKDYEAILPGVILAGFGFHFHISKHLSIWPNSTGVFILIIALAFLLRYQKAGVGLLQGLLFLALAIILLFYDRIMNWLGLLETGVATFVKFWPLILVGCGVYLLFIRRK